MKTGCSGVSELAARFGDMVPGARSLARAVVQAHDLAVDRLVTLARKKGVSETKIAAALKMKAKHDRLMSIVSLVVPVVPNPTLLRALAHDRTVGGRSAKKDAAAYFDKKERDAARARLKEKKQAVRTRVKQRTKERKTARAACREGRAEARSNKGLRRTAALQQADRACAVRSALIERRAAQDLDRLVEVVEKEQAEQAQNRVFERWGKARRKERDAQTTAAERLQERDSQVESNVRGWDARLVPVWRKERTEAKYRGLSADRAYERFVEWAQGELSDDGRGNIIAAEATRAEAIEDADRACAEAAYYAREGSDEARRFHASRCDGDTARRDSKGRLTDAFGRRLTAKERTGNLFDLPPAREAPAAPEARPEKAKASRKGRRIQQSLSVGPLGTPIDDVPF